MSQMGNLFAPATPDERAEWDSLRGQAAGLGRHLAIALVVAAVALGFFLIASAVLVAAGFTNGTHPLYSVGFLVAVAAAVLARDLLRRS